jgi:purine-binding chemotaxis protein CheW
VSRVLVVRVGAERVAVPIGAVREVLDAPEVWPVPLAPSAVCGQVAVRGQHVPVLDLAVLLGIPREAPGAPVVLVMGDGAYALAVDDAVDFWDPGASAARPLPAGADQRAPLRGLLQEGTQVALVVDETVLMGRALATLRESSPA